MNRGLIRMNFKNVRVPGFVKTLNGSPPTLDVVHNVDPEPEGSGSVAASPYKYECLGIVHRAHLNC
jgi:hypothetical protein